MHKGLRTDFGDRHIFFNQLLYEVLLIMSLYKHTGLLRQVFCNYCVTYELKQICHAVVQHNI